MVIRDETAAKATGATAAEPAGGILDAAAPVRNKGPDRIAPDRAFIDALIEQVGPSFRRCMQCGTCSAVCALSPDDRPFPRKEVVWAVWGVKERLLADPDVWLCYQCNDCSTRCPRGARPGDVLSAVRQQVVLENAAPRFLGRWVNRARYIPLLLGFPAVLLAAAALGRGRLATWFGFDERLGDDIVFSYSSFLPHWLLNGFFLAFALLIGVAAAVGIARYWRRLRRDAESRGEYVPVRGMGASIASALGSVFRHDDFASCTASSGRFVAHLSAFFGFAALSVVTFWVITSGINPLIRGTFVYPFAFLSPWKLLANLGGLALLFGCALMIQQRSRETAHRGANNYYNWSLVATLLIVVFTGFVTEVLHYMRLEPHRHVIYFVHLVFVFALLVTMPYSKLAHLLYRTTALVFAARIGRRRAGPAIVEPESAEPVTARPAAAEPAIPGEPA